MKRIILLAVLLAVAGASSWVPAGQQQKAGGEAGLVLSVTGAVTYIAGKGAPAEIKAYMKVELGDVITVPGKGAVEIVYFNGNRKERWVGPVVFTVGAAGGSAQDGPGSKKPEVGTVPAGASYGVKRLPEFLRKAGYGRSGVTAVRDLPGDGEKKPARALSTAEAEEIEAARKAASEMRKSGRPDDVTPDLSLLCVLADYRQFDEMEKVLAEAMKKHPGSPELEAVRGWVERENGARR